MFIVCDASQLEWRVILELAKDYTGINEILNKEDTHQKNQDFLKLPSRLIAKIFLFRTIFRGSGWSFANDPNFMHVSTSAKYWDKANEGFYKKYFKIDEVHKEWAHLVMNGIPLEGPSGRQWPIEMGFDEKKQESYIPWTVLSNYPVQGTAADIMTLARILVMEMIEEAKLTNIKLLSSVHDSIILDSVLKNLEPLNEIFHYVFNNLHLSIKKAFGYTWECPLACEVKYGNNLKDTQKYVLTS